MRKSGQSREARSCRAGRGGKRGRLGNGELNIVPRHREREEMRLEKASRPFRFNIGCIQTRREERRFLLTPACVRGTCLWCYKRRCFRLLLLLLLWLVARATSKFRGPFRRQQRSFGTTCVFLKRCGSALFGVPLSGYNFFSHEHVFGKERGARTLAGKSKTDRCLFPDLMFCFLVVFCFSLWYDFSSFLC